MDFFFHFQFLVRIINIICFLFFFTYFVIIVFSVGFISTVPNNCIVFLEITVAWCEFFP